MITERDKRVLCLIEKFKACSAGQLYKMVYSGVSYRYFNHRMKKLVDGKLLKRSREHVDLPYVYYQRKPKQLIHALKLVDVYIYFDMPQVFEVEYTVENVRADAYTEVIRGNKLYSYFVEIQLNNQFNWQKYVQLYNAHNWERYFEVFPYVFVVGKEVETTGRPKFIFKEV